MAGAFCTCRLYLQVLSVPVTHDCVHSDSFGHGAEGNKPLAGSNPRLPLCLSTILFAHPFLSLAWPLGQYVCRVV
jgi:hypothetical protein